MNHHEPAAGGRWIGPALLTLLFLLLYGPFLAGYSPSGGDIVNQYLPYQQLIRDAVRQGAAPLWNSFTFCGRPLMADIQTGVLYPPNWLHWLLPLPLSFALVLALHGAWMIGGCWRLGRHWGLAAPAIALGATLYCAGPFFMLKPAQGIILFIYVGAWWPWLVLGASRLVERPGAGRMAALAAALALSLLAGSPQITYYGWLATLAIALALPSPEGTAGARAWARRLPWLAFAFLFALGLTAVQTAQTYYFIRSSYDRGAGASFDYVADGSFQPRLLWLLVNPGYLGIGHSDNYEYWGSRLDFSEACFYAPLWVLAILTPLGLFKCGMRSAECGIKTKIYRRLAIVGGLGMVLGLGLALGAYSPVFRVFYSFFPGFNRFRVPSRLMIFFASGEALLAALALNALLTPAALPRRGARVAIALGAAVALLLVWAGMGLHESIWHALGNPILGRVPVSAVHITHFAYATAAMVTAGLILAAAALWRLSRAEKSSGRWLPWTLTVLAAAELALLAAPFNRKIDFFSRFADKHYPKTELVRLLEREHRGGRILWTNSLIDYHFDQNQPEIYPNRLIMYGLPDARGYDPVNSIWIGFWMNLLAGFAPEDPPRGFMNVPEVVRPAWLTLMGVETVLTYEDLPTTAGLRLVGQFNMRDEFSPAPATLRVWRNERFRGMAFAAPMPSVIRAGGSSLREAATLSLNPELAPEAAIVMNDTFLNDLGPDARLATSVDEKRFVTRALPSNPNSHRYATDWPEPALLYLAESCYAGWMGSIDGQPAPLHTACGTFLAMPVPAGSHEVEVTFQPEGLAAGKLISLCTLAVLLYGILRERLKRRLERSAQA